MTTRTELQTAFDYINMNGGYATQPIACCNNCSVAGIERRLESFGASIDDMRSVVFWHEQDEDSSFVEHDFMIDDCGKDEEDQEIVDVSRWDQVVYTLHLGWFGDMSFIREAFDVAGIVAIWPEDESKKIQIMGAWDIDDGIENILDNAPSDAV